MNLHRILLTVCALLILNLQLFSQSHDKAGYYIDLKGDTVPGKFLNYRYPSKSPLALSFQATRATEPISLTPAQCKVVSIDQTDHYISYQGRRQINSIQYEDVQTDTADRFVDISAFLLELYNDGQYHLFQFNDSKRPNFYISTGDGPLQELSYKEFVNNGRVIQWPGFRLQLEDFFRPFLQKDPSRQRLIDHVSYNEASLTDLFDEIIGNKNKSAASTRKYPGQLFLGGGISINSLKVSGDNQNFPINPRQTGAYSSQITPLFEFAYRFFSQRHEGRLFLIFRASYYHFQNEKSYQDNINNGIISVTYRGNVLSFPLGAGYKLINRQNFSLDLSAGASVDFLIRNSETDTETGLSNYARTIDDPFRHTSLFGELSLEFLNRLSIYTAYNTPVSIANSEEYNPVHTSIKLGARVRVF